MISKSRYINLLTIYPQGHLLPACIPPAHETERVFHYKIKDRSLNEVWGDRHCRTDDEGEKSFEGGRGLRQRLYDLSRPEQAEQAIGTVAMADPEVLPQ